MTDDADTMGPVSYLIVEFPGNRMTGEGFEALIDLVDRGLIAILDLEFITRGDDGSVAALSLHELDGGGFDLSVFEGVSSGLLDQTDYEEAIEIIEPGSSAAILLFENRWAAPFMRGLRGSKAEVVAAGYIPLADLAAALDDLEAD